MRAATSRNLCRSYGTLSYFPLDPALNHPNPRKGGVAWGPRYALG